MIRSADTRTSTWVFAEHLRPRHGLLNGRRPEDDLRKAPNAQRIYAGPVRRKVAGLIALAGLGTEIGSVMLLYLDKSYEGFKSAGRMNTRSGHAVIVASPGTQNGEGVHE
jgi:hypothetical protein